MVWIIFLALTILFWGSYNLFFKLVGNQINYFLSLLIIGVFQIVLALPFVLHDSFKNNLIYSTKGILLSSIMGLLLGLGTIFFFYTFKNGASSSVAIPIYTVGALLIGVVGGIILFRENLDLKIILGICLGILSIILLTTK